MGHLFLMPECAIPATTGSHSFPRAEHTPWHSAHSSSHLWVCLTSCRQISPPAGSAASSASPRARLPLPGQSKEISGKVVQGHVISGEVIGHGQVHVGTIELQVDLAVNGGLRVRVKVLAHPGRGAGGICRPPGKRRLRPAGGWGRPAGNLRTAWDPAQESEAVARTAQEHQRCADVLGKEQETGQHSLSYLEVGNRGQAGSARSQAPPGHQI